jgi:hypothetical protein
MLQLPSRLAFYTAALAPSLRSKGRPDSSMLMVCTVPGFTPNRSAILRRVRPQRPLARCFRSAATSAARRARFAGGLPQTDCAKKRFGRATAHAFPA